jgi:hypothetical protein
LKKSTLPALAALVLLGIPGLAADRDTTEEWHILYLLGEPTGYAHQIVRPREGGGVVATSTQKLTIKRGATTLELEMSSSTEEDADGHVVAFRLLQKLSKQATEVVGTRKGDVFVVTTKVGGRSRQSTIPVDPAGLGPIHAAKILGERLKKPGDSAKVRVFVPDIKDYANHKVVFERSETVALIGSEKNLRYLTSTSDAFPGMVEKQWVDDEFHLQKSSVSILGMELVSYRSTLEAVLAADFSSPPELYFSLAIPLKQAVSDDAREVVYRIQSKNESSLDNVTDKLFAGAGQKILRREDPRTIVLRVRKVLARHSVVRPVKPTAQLDEYLQPNTYIQSDDKSLVDLARKIVGGETDAWKAALLLERWVYDNVTDKNLDTGFATAIEVAETRSGDCTEHSVLLAALLRATGIPSRVVAGLVGFGKSLVGHMWTEVHIGEWIPLDATRGKGGVGADHIGLAVSSLGDASLSDLFLGISPILGKVNVEVVETFD